MCEQKSFKNDMRLKDIQIQEEENYRANESIMNLIDKDNTKEQLLWKNKQKLHQQMLDAFTQSQERKKMEKIEESQLNSKIMEIQNAKGVSYQGF